MKFSTDTSVRIVLVTKKYAECRDFYENILRLPIYRQWDRGETDRWVVYELGNTHVEILPGSSNPVLENTYTYIPVDDVDAVLEELQTLTKIVEPIQSYPWGHRSFSVLDPVGMKLKFFSTFEADH